MRAQLAVLALLAILACSSGRAVTLERGATAPKPANSTCYWFDLDDAGSSVRPGLRLRAGEAATEFACEQDDGPTAHGAFVIDRLDLTTPIEERLVEAFPPANPDWEVGATGPHSSAAAKLSTALGFEHRQPYDSVTPRLLVVRYAQRGNTLFAAWIRGKPSEMDAREAENAAWLDAVRFDDLTSPK